MRYLYDKTEKIILEYDSELFEHPHLSTGNKVISARKGDAIGPLHPGHYLIYENTGASEKRIRYLGIAPDHAVILQLSVAAFSADNFDSVAHAKRVPVNYCVAPDQLNDSTFRGFEQDYGDTVYPLEEPKHPSPKNASPNGCVSSTRGSSPKDSPSCADSRPTIPRPPSSAR